MKDIFRKFLENKDRLIDKLDLTDEQKGQLKTFFNSHPNFENKIDWNKKDLKWEDFQEVLKLEGNTKSSQKKYGLSGKAQIEDLVEGKDYDVILEEPQFCIYYPLTFKGSETLAKPTTPPLDVTGKWCIAGKNYSPGTRDQHWKRYTEERDIDFFFLFMEHRKYAIARYADNHIDIFDQTDNKVSDIWDYSDRYDKMHINIKWLQKLMDNQPHKLQEEKFSKHQFYEDSYGNRWLGKVALTAVELEIPTDVVGIGARAGRNCTKLKKLHIPASVRRIEPEAFAGCTSLEEITIDMSSSVRISHQPNVQKIFEGSTGKLTINIVDEQYPENGDLFIEASSLFEKSNISSLHITCPNMTSYTIPERCFENCKNLKTVILENCVYIDTEAFYNCVNLETVVIQSKLFGTGLEAFGNCQHLTRVQFSPDCRILRLEAGTFERCRLLNQIQLPSCEYIENAVFSDCWKLEQLVLPADLVELGNFEGGSDINTLFDDLYPMNQNKFNITFMGTKDQWNKLLAPMKQNNPEEYEFLMGHTICTGQTASAKKAPAKKQQVK